MPLLFFGKYYKYGFFEMALTRPKYSQIYDSDYKNSCRVATTGDVTLTGGAPNSVDGISLALYDRILVRSQSTSSQNGIYFVTTLGTGSNGTWTRALDANDGTRLTSGTTVNVEEGLTLGGKMYRMTTPNPITIGSSAIAWTDVSGGGAAAGGLNGQVQFNSTNAFGGATYLTYITGTGQVIANAGIASSSTSTGTMVVTGGVGISGALYTTTINTTNLSATNITSANTHITSSDSGIGIGHDNVVSRIGNVYVTTTNTTNFSTGNAQITGGTINGTLSDTSNRVVTSVTLSAGSGISISSATTTGPSAAATVNNSGVLSFNTRTGAVTLSSSDVTTALSYTPSQSATSTNSVYSFDSRSTNYVPSDRNAGLYVDFKTNTTDGLSDGGTYHGVLTFRSYGSGTDLSGGQVQQIAYTDNNNLWHRISTSASAWGSWIRVLDSSNYSSFALPLSGGTMTGTLTTQGIVPSANASYNIGSSTAWYGTIYGVSTQAKYADLAEKYKSDTIYEPGTVVVFGGNEEITVSTVDHDPAVAGVISTDPAYLMNADTEGLPVAFTGRVPCKVLGPVKKGQVLVTSHIMGVAQAINNSKYVPGCVIGKSLETIETTEVKTIEVVVGRF